MQRRFLIIAYTPLLGRASADIGLDGGGGLSRPNDLQTMRDACDYCFSRSSLDGLRVILARHL